MNEREIELKKRVKPIIKRLTIENWSKPELIVVIGTLLANTKINIKEVNSLLDDLKNFKDTRDMEKLKEKK